MNQKTTYELTISNKLQQLTVPDMSDAIWSRIEMQLDLDMPTDPGNGSGNDNPHSGGSFPVGSILSVFVVALITVFFINKWSQRKQHGGGPKSNAKAVSVIRDNNATLDDRVEKNKEHNISIPSLNSMHETIIPVAEDSTVKLPQTINPVVDSTEQTLQTLPELDATMESLKPKPKSKGVQGISDNDYRIVPVKKDST